MKERFKLTPLEKSWILYDIGNSAFILMVSTLIPIFFNSLASAAGVNEDLYLSYWGYAGSLATILVAVIGPICGTLADRRFKKLIFALCLICFRHFCLLSAVKFEKHSQNPEKLYHIICRLSIDFENVSHILFQVIFFKKPLDKMGKMC